MADQLRVSKDNLACSFVLTELQALADRGGGSVRENPLRSPHWELTQKKQMMATGLWQDTVYSALWGRGVRLSACVTTLMRDCTVACSPVPSHPRSRRVAALSSGWSACVPLQLEEAEYTALLAFGIAVSASWCAARMGLAKLRVPRFPFVETAGRREHWLQIDPRALREWAMAPTAIALGLRPTHPEERARTPRRTRVVDVILEDKTLPPGVVYVGRGHHSHPLPVTKWSSLFVPGHNCDSSSWLPLYVEHIMQHLAGELTGCVLACDCEMHMVCEGDALAGLVFEFGRPPARTKKKRQAGASGQVRRVLAAVAALPPYGGRSHPVLVARGGSGCVSLALPSALFRELLLSYGGGLGELTCFTQWLRSRGLRWMGRWSQCWLPLNRPRPPIWALLRAALRAQPGLSRRAIAIADGATASDGSGFAICS